MFQSLAGQLQPNPLGEGGLGTRADSETKWLEGLDGLGVFGILG